MQRLLFLIVVSAALTGVVNAREVTPMPGMENGAYIAQVSTTPAEIEANKPFVLTVTVLKSDGKTPVVDFDEVHTKLLHLILVSQDLTQFLHVHPDYKGAGVFELRDLVLPEAANYVVYADFTPAGAHQQVARTILSVTGAANQEAHLAASVPSMTVGDLTVSLDMASGYTAGAETHLSFKVSDSKSGAPVDNLDEFLGAAGHLVIIDESNETYIHTHPADHAMMDMAGMSSMATATPAMAGMDMPAKYGPDLDFMTEFPHGGFWAMWLQIQYEGEVFTFPFVVEVIENSESTPQAHTHG